MSNRDADDFELTPELLLRAYTIGVFPMAESRDAPTISWIDPRSRGVLPLNAVHVPRSLKKTLRKQKFTIRCNTAFAEVVEECARRTRGRKETWINDQIERAVNALYDMGFAFSLESWDNEGLAGGLYGIALGGVFFGESMFSRRTDASKVALMHLVARLRLGRFKMLDTQFITDHLNRFGAIEIPARDFQQKLESALAAHGHLSQFTDDETVAEELERMFDESSRGPILPA